MTAAGAEERRVVRAAVRDFVVGDVRDERLGRVVTEVLLVELRKLLRTNVTVMEGG